MAFSAFGGLQMPASTKYMVTKPKQLQLLDVRAYRSEAFSPTAIMGLKSIQPLPYMRHHEYFS